MIARHSFLTALAALALLSGVPGLAAAAPAANTPVTDFKGQEMTLEQYRGRVVLLNFWATWCVPCLQEMPDLDRVSQKLDSKRAVVIGIALDDPKRAEAMAKKLGVKYRLAAGDRNALFAWTAKMGNANLSLPFNVLLDAKGEVRWSRADRVVTEEEAAQLIDKVLSGKPL